MAPHHLSTRSNNGCTKTRNPRPNRPGARMREPPPKLRRLNPPACAPASRNRPARPRSSVCRRYPGLCLVHCPYSDSSHPRSVDLCSHYSRGIRRLSRKMRPPVELSKPHADYRPRQMSKRLPLDNGRQRLPKLENYELSVIRRTTLWTWRFWAAGRAAGQARALRSHPVAIPAHQLRRIPSALSPALRQSPQSPHGGA